MNFFEHQEEARKASKKLVLLFVVSVIAIILLINLVVLGVAYFGFQNYLFMDALKQNDITFSRLLSAGWKHNLILSTSAITLLVIALASLFKWISLRGGGGRVAESMGGRLVARSSQDPEEIKLLNIVEEMAVASGVPVPDVYLLEEAGINAFAAGHTIHNAAIGVTRGLIQNLNRDELQGVIAHEFSHIFHGDMKLNMRLISLLFGIVALATIGRILMQSGFYGSVGRSRRENSGAAFALAGVGIFAIGSVGIFFARWIQSAVSRQREFLADASAVQYTRNPDGISGALQKIGALSMGSRLQNVEAKENSHMMFSSSFASLFATHPPLLDRIRAIDPKFKGDFSKIALKHQSPVIKKSSPQKKMGLEDIFGNPQNASVIAASALLSESHPSLREAAHEPSSARALAFALLFDKEKPAIQKKQASYLLQKEGPEFLKLCLYLFDQILKDENPSSLPYLEISLPALRRLSKPQREDFISSLRILIEADHRLSILEFSILQMVKKNLESAHQSPPKKSMQESILLILSAIAYAGYRGGLAPAAAFEAGAKTIGLPNASLLPSEKCGLQNLAIAFDRAATLKPAQKEKLIHAVSAIISADAQTLPREYELLQALGICIGTPLPIRAI